MATPKTTKTTKQPLKAQSSKVGATGGSFFLNMENRLQHNATTLFWVVSVLCLLFSVLLFNARITEANDDSLYIEAGFNYAKGFFSYYYTANAPLYPMFLSLPIKLFGLNLILLKSLSVVFNYLQLLFLYKALKGRIPYLILFPVLFIVAFNASFQYFASQTYTESFFLMFQSLFLLAFVKLLDKINENPSLKTTYTQWLWVGLLVFILAMTKNVAIATVPVLMFFFCIRKQWLHAGLALISFLVVKLPFELFKTIAWGAQGNQYSQTSILFMKDPYDVSKGKEGAMGFVARLFDNADLYISKRFFQILGFMSEDNVNTSKVLTFLVVALMLFGLYRAFKAGNSLVVFVALYVLAMCAASFIALQIRWDQPRIIMIYVPLMLILILYGFYQLLSKTGSAAQLTFLYTIVILFLVDAGATLGKTQKNFKILTKNLKGDMYYGYTPDWINYLKMSEWCAKNLPDSAVVACRKAPMSFVYGKGRKFHPVYRVFSSDPDSVLDNFKRAKVSYVIVASLRRNPRVNDGEIINTMHRLFAPIQEKYPNKLEQVQLIGDSEPAYLFKINYNK